MYICIYVYIYDMYIYIYTSILFSVLGWLIEGSFPTINRCMMNGIANHPLFLPSTENCLGHQNLSISRSCLGNMRKHRHLWMVATLKPYGGFHKWGTPKWIIYNGKSLENRWFRGTPILGNLHICTSPEVLEFAPDSRLVLVDHLVITAPIFDCLLPQKIARIFSSPQNPWIYLRFTAIP